MSIATAAAMFTQPQSQIPKLNTTKKKRDKHKKRNKTVDKQKLWSQFNTEITENDRNDVNNKTPPLECIYTATGVRSMCNICTYPVGIADNGFYCCTNPKCGVLYTDHVSKEAEWRFYGAEDSRHGRDPSRCGMPINPLLKQSSYGCKVLCRNTSSHEMRKIRRYTEWQSTPYKEKSLYDEFQRIITMGQNSGIPKLILDDAQRYHKKISEQQTFRGLNRDGIIAASIYVSCRKNNYPRTAKEIATIFNLDNSSTTRGCKNAISIINEQEHGMANNNKTVFCETRPELFIERYCSRLNMNTQITKLCMFVAIWIQKNNLIPENTPHSIAAGIVYFISQICNLNVTKKEINYVSEISEVTINKCYKKLEVLKKDIIPTSILEKYA